MAGGEAATDDEPKTTISVFQFPVLQDRECESRLFEGWRETTHWRKFIVNSPRVVGSSKEEESETLLLRCF